MRLKLLTGEPTHKNCSQTRTDITCNKWLPQDLIQELKVTPFPIPYLKATCKSSLFLLKTI